jgi:hypothetical protein
MTIDLVLGVPAGRHMKVAAARASRPEDELALYGEALASLGEQAFTTWSAKRCREMGLVQAHLAPIRSRQSLAASFGRESFHGSEPATVETALSRLRLSPVLGAYATRWLELAEG